MSITTITADELRQMQDQEGLILQGCGGEPQEWLDGINDLFTSEGILLNGTRFQDCSVFQHGGRTCILFPFEGVELNIGRLAMWRIQTRGNYGGTWLSDYIPNYLDNPDYAEEPAMRKPDCPLIGQDGNIFNLLGIASRTLKNHDMADEASEMRNRVMSSGSYDEALSIIGEYVHITSVDETVSEDMEEDLGIQM